MWHIKLLLLSVVVVVVVLVLEFGQEPDPSQATGMALVSCILGKFLGVVCHCFPPRLDIPTFAARCLHVHNDVTDPSSERRTMGEKGCPVILPTWHL